MTPALFVATLAGAGRLRPGPGTWGSAVVLPALWLGPLPCLALSLLALLAGWWAAGEVLRGGAEDPGWFVADEAAGMLLALAALPSATLPGALAAFALFRLFDIAKPWPISWADRQSGPFWVMVDDMIAGAIAALLLLAFHAALPGVLA
ncbi:phosphatidylglycerophosphatase A family protein [Falsiroseomonas selenitidurans]|uniref:Phosphatidylglycerophosphatase A n=1 Tax=Falsiroseomonas selenitidurans TaxID=2716335 RepID=A0ABX1E117_9PROT|nr:phosphatidylglycerophosphatase A [Falsiroseomonas selenitidurans]NKC30375.1 phosphatidylglycerophosphatase A [Falsiroseomonas selenitidurans]